MHVGDILDSNDNPCDKVRECTAWLAYAHAAMEEGGLSEQEAKDRASAYVETIK